MPASSSASTTSSIPDEEEPRLKYRRLEADVGDLLLDTEAACLCVSEKMLALGTREGSVHLLDYDGNEVGSYCVHLQDTKPLPVRHAMQDIVSLIHHRVFVHCVFVHCACCCCATSWWP